MQLKTYCGRCTVFVQLVSDTDFEQDYDPVFFHCWSKRTEQATHTELQEDFYAKHCNFFPDLYRSGQCRNPTPIIFVD